MYYRRLFKIRGTTEADLQTISFMAADRDIMAVKIQGNEVCIFHDLHHDYIFLKKKGYTRTLIIQFLLLEDISLSQHYMPDNFYGLPGVVHTGWFVIAGLGSVQSRE